MQATAKLLRVGALFVAATLLSSFAFAQAKTYRVGSGSPAQQLATVESDTEFETFTGRTEKVTGSLTFDPAKRTGSGRITVDAASIKTGIDLRDEHMRSADWLDTAKFPTITFETTEVRHIRGDQYRVTGRFTMHGVTRTITTTATVRHRPESDATRSAGFRGDVLRVAVNFNVKLADYGIVISPRARGKVAGTVRLNVVVFGQSGS